MISDRSPPQWLDHIAAKSGSIIRGSAVASIAAFLVLPTLLVIGMSLSSETYIQFPPREVSIRWYIAYLADPQWIAATALSLKIAFGAMVMSTSKVVKLAVITSTTYGSARTVWAITKPK